MYTYIYIYIHTYRELHVMSHVWTSHATDIDASYNTHYQSAERRPNAWEDELLPNALHNNTPQHTAIHCNTLQSTATHGNTRQHTYRQTADWRPNIWGAETWRDQRLLPAPQSNPSTALALALSLMARHNIYFFLAQVWSDGEVDLKIRRKKVAFLFLERVEVGLGTSRTNKDSHWNLN